MLQIVMAHAIMAGMVTPEEADLVVSRLYHQKLPDKPSEVWDGIKRAIEQVKRESADRQAP